MSFAMLIKRQETSCDQMGNGYPFCSPAFTDTWYNGSEYSFVWNSNYPFYVESSELDLHLYYLENFVYVPIKSWDGISRSAGSLSVLVDDSWFPKPVPTGEANHTWTMYGYYLPAGMNATQQISDTKSMYPQPFNFSVVQFASPNGNNNGNGGGSGSGGSSSSSNGLPGWSIAVIVIACIAFITAVAAIIWGILVFRRYRQRNLNAKNATSRPLDANAMPMASTDFVNGSFRPTFYDGTSIHSSTPIIAAGVRASMSPRTSGGDLESDMPRTGQPHDSLGYHGSVDDRFRQLLQKSEFAGLSGEEVEQELNRRRLGEALLQRELAEEGTSVKHAERRPLTIRTVPEPETSQIVMERQDLP